MRQTEPHTDCCWPRGYRVKKRINRYSAEQPSVVPGGLYWAACIAILAWLVRDALQGPVALYAFGTEYWEHTALLRAWLADLANPGNPHVDAAALSSRYMPWFWMLAAAGRALGLDAIQLMSVSAVGGFVVLVVGLKLFLDSYFRNPWAPLLGAVVLFGCWGVGWVWPNVLQLRGLFYVAAYPSTLVFGLSLIAFWLTMKLIRNEASPLVLGAALALLVAVMFLCHPLTGVFGIAGCALLVFTESTYSRSREVAALLALLSGAALAELWPWFSVWTLVLGLYGPGLEVWPTMEQLRSPLTRLLSDDWQHPFYDPRQVVVALGPALLGLPLVAWLAARREQLFIVYGAGLMALPWVLNLLIPVPMGHRFLLFAVFYLHMAIIWGWLRLLSGWRAVPQPPAAVPLVLVSIAAALMLVAANVWLARAELQGTTLRPALLRMVDARGAIPGGGTIPDLYRRLLEPVGADNVVLTTGELGWPVPTFGPKVTAIKDENPLLTDQLERYQAVAAFFFRPMDDLTRVEIVQRYGANYLLLDAANKSNNASLLQWLNSYARQVATVGSLQMYALSPALQTIVLPQPEPVVTEPEPAQQQPEARAVRPSRPAAVPMILRPAREPADSDDDDGTPAYGAPIPEPIVD